MRFFAIASRFLAANNYSSKLSFLVLYSILGYVSISSTFETGLYMLTKSERGDSIQMKEELLLTLLLSFFMDLSLLKTWRGHLLYSHNTGK